MDDAEFIASISEEVKVDIEAWFHKNIEDGVYSEALYDLQQIIEGHFTACLSAELEARKERGVSEAECEALEVRTKDLETNFEAISEMTDEVEEKIDEIREFITETLKKDTKK